MNFPDKQFIGSVAPFTAALTHIFDAMKGNLIQKDRELIWHPYTQQWEQPDSVGIVKGKGTILIDEHGNEIIDAISSWWVTIHGHAHPHIAEKIYNQALELEQVIFAGFTHKPAVSLAERLIEILPGGMSKIFYSDNGSTAVEVAIKMAVQFWRNSTLENAELKRRKILALKNSYHGDTFGAMSVSERGLFTFAFQDYLFEVEFIDLPDSNNISPLEKRIDEEGDAIACFIYEPMIQGAGGMKMMDAILLNRLLEKLKSKDIICIADEVMTGFGRTGKLFASEYISVTPDMLCLSKGLTGGTMAMGVTACTEKIHTAYISSDRKKTFFHGHSFTANPLACTAALASLDLLLDKQCLHQILWIAEKNRSFIETLKKTPAYITGKILNLRYCGTILAFEIENTDGNYLHHSGKKIAAGAMEMGVLLRPLGNTIYIMPPYCITEDEINKVYEVILKLIQKEIAILPDGSPIDFLH